MASPRSPDRTHHVIHDARGIRRLRGDALTTIADRIEAIEAITSLMDNVAAEVSLSDPEDKITRAVATMTPLAAGITEAALDVAQALGGLRALSRLEGVRIEDLSTDG